MATLQKIYSDIDFTFLPKPVVKDIALSYDTQAIIRSIRNLLLTNYYERPFNPELGSDIRALLFEPVDSVFGAAIERRLLDVVNNYEPRVSIESVVAIPAPDENGYKVILTFFIVNLPNPITINFFLERIR